MIGLFRGLSLEYRLGAVAFPIVLLLCFSIEGCANSCFVAVLNPGGTVVGGTVSNLPLTCPPPIKKTKVSVFANVTPLYEASSASNRIQGFFLYLGGIELHAKASTLGDTSEWLELFPDLVHRPRQVARGVGYAIQSCRIKVILRRCLRPGMPAASQDSIA